MLVPKLRFKEFNDEWNQKKLINIANLFKGNGISKSDITEDGNECILYGELYTTYNEIIENIKSKTNKDLKSKVLCRYNDVIIPASGETPDDIAKASCILKDNVILGGDLNVIRLKDMDGRFLSYQINYKRKKELANLSQGHSIVHLYWEKFKNINIIYPTKNEQIKIANLLQLLDKKIELQSKKIEVLKLYSESTKNIIFKSFKNNNNTIYSLKDLLKEVNNKAKINNQYSIISSTTKGVFLQSDYFNKQAASSNTIGYKIIEKNQLVLSPQNLWMGNININDKYDIGIVSPSYKIFDVNHNIDLNILDAWIKSKKAIYDYNLSSEQGASVVRKNLNLDLFYEISLYLPKIQEQKKYGNLLVNLKNKIKLEDKKLNKMIQLKKGLMQNMFV